MASFACGQDSEPLAGGRQFRSLPQIRRESPEPKDAAAIENSLDAPSMAGAAVEQRSATSIRRQRSSLRRQDSSASQQNAEADHSVDASSALGSAPAPAFQLQRGAALGLAAAEPLQRAAQPPQRHTGLSVPVQEIVAAPPPLSVQAHPPAIKQSRGSVHSASSAGSLYTSDTRDTRGESRGIFSRCFGRCFGQGAVDEVVWDHHDKLVDTMHDMLESHLCYGEGRLYLQEWLPRVVAESQRKQQSLLESLAAANRQRAAGPDPALLDEVRGARADVQGTQSSVEVLLEQVAAMLEEREQAAQIATNAAELKAEANNEDIQNRFLVMSKLDTLTNLVGEVGHRLSVLEQAAAPKQELVQPVAHAKVVDDSADEALESIDEKIHNFNQVMQATLPRVLETSKRSCKHMEGAVGAVKTMQVELGKHVQFATHSCQQFAQSQNQVLASYQQAFQRLAQVTAYLENCGKQIDYARVEMTSAQSRDAQGLLQKDAGSHRGQRPAAPPAAQVASIPQTLVPQAVPPPSFGALQTRDHLQLLREEILREIDGLKVSVQQCLQAKQTMLSVDDLKGLLQDVVREKQSQGFAKTGGRERHAHFDDDDDLDDSVHTLMMPVAAAGGAQYPGHSAKQPSRSRSMQRHGSTDASRSRRHGGGPRPPDASPG